MSAALRALDRLETWQQERMMAMHGPKGRFWNKSDEELEQMRIDCHDRWIWENGDEEELTMARLIVDEQNRRHIVNVEREHDKRFEELVGVSSRPGTLTGDTPFWRLCQFVHFHVIRRCTRLWRR